MRSARLLTAATAAAWVVTCAGAVLAAPGPLTVEDAVALALRTNPRLAAARERLRAGEAGASAAGRRMLPSVHLNEEYQIFDSPFVINFGMPVQVRDQRTNTFVAAADQPVLGLLRLENERTALTEGTAAAEAQLAAAEADLRQAVETQYLQVFEATALQQIADASVRELTDQLAVAKARLASGVITEADRLRIEVAIANAHQQGLQAQSQARTARARLVAAIGLPVAEAGELTLVEPRALLAAARAPMASAGALLPQARLRRPELAQQQHLALSAARQARARGYALLPEIDLEAAYTRIDGQIFAPKNSGFVGVKAQWAIWEWGASLLAHRAANAQATAARRDVDALEREIEAELESSVAQGDAARGAVDAAEKAIAGAEEAFRVTGAQVKAGSATTTDLLQAQAELTQARLNLTRAQYELALAAVAVRRASGG